MTQRHIQRQSMSPYVDRIWKSTNLDDGVYLATPDGSWDLIFCNNKDGSDVAWLAGQATKSTYVPYTKGTSSVVISFSAGVYMPSFKGDSIIDKVIVLPSPEPGYFELNGLPFAIPSFDTAEDLVNGLLQRKIIVLDEIVASVIAGTSKAKSDRSIQRHFHSVTGMSSKSLHQIWHAQDAVRKLKDGQDPKDAAANAGYSDQPHMAKSLKKIMNSRPSDVQNIHKL